MTDIRIDNRMSDATVIVFSGIAPMNHVYEWTRSFSDFPVNVIGVRDPYECWYQRETGALLDTLGFATSGDRWIACVGGSAGGFAALKFGRALNADRVVAFVPQTACGAVKRALGDFRWRDECEATPADDIAGWHGKAIVHYAADEPLDVMHAQRLCGADLREWPEGGHALPHRLKEAGELRAVLQEAMP